VTGRELLAAYAATAWKVDLPAGAAWVRPGAAADQSLRPAGIVTAHNPASDPKTTERQNRSAQAALLRELRLRRISFFPALAVPSAPDAGRWTEPGFALLGIDRETAVELGERFGQNAIVWIDTAGHVSLVATRVGFCGANPGQELEMPDEHPPCVVAGDAETVSLLNDIRVAEEQIARGEGMEHDDALALVRARLRL
jgi:hypothetical protein